jgi:hypothetical protein
MGADKIEQAFPLARELHRDLTLEAWREYTRLFGPLRPIETGHRGILVTEQSGYLRGLLSYDLLPDLSDNKFMTVRDVVIPALPAGQAAARSLLEELFEISEAYRCNRISVDLTTGMEWLAREWSDPGGRLFRIPITCFVVRSSSATPPALPRRQPQPVLRLVELNRQPRTASSKQTQI